MINVPPSTLPLGNNVGTSPNNTIALGIINNGAIPGPTTSRWNVRTGGESQTSYVGSQPQITGIGVQCQNQGYEYHIQGRHKWTITITFPVDIIVNGFDAGEPPPLTIWEINYQPSKQNLFEATDRPFIAKLGQTTKDKIDQQMRQPVTITAGFTGDSDPLPALSAHVAYNLKRINVEGKNLFVPTLKRSIVMSNGFSPNTTNVPIYGTHPQAPWDLSTRGQLFRTQDLVGKYGPVSLGPFQAIPPFIVAQLPTTIPLRYWKFTGTGKLIPNPLPVSGWSVDTNGIVTYVGWLEFPPEYQTISLTKVQASQQWQFNKWSAGDYGLYDVAGYNTSNLIDTTAQPVPGPLATGVGPLSETDLI